MKRMQLALNVSNLNESIDFYSKFFDAEPAKVRPGYANFAIDEPPLKLVLIEGGGTPGAINHLGVETFSPAAVVEASDYFAHVGLTTRDENQTTCCYALQDKVWVEGPDGAQWEVYTVLADAPSEERAGDGQCCTTSSANSEALVVSTNCC